MWTSKISFDGTKAAIGSRTLKHNISISGFPLSYFYHKKYVIVNVIGIISGKEKNKEEFIKDWKKSGRLLNLEINGDFFIGTIKEPIISKNIYNKDIIHLEPAIIDEKGIETVNLASFDKKSIIRGIKSLEKLNKTKIYYIAKRKVKGISLFRENPELTEKQKIAMNLAVKGSYYEYPRKIELEKLAKLMGISYSTYQAHLRKAEKKLLPFFFEKSK